MKSDVGQYWLCTSCRRYLCSLTSFRLSSRRIGRRFFLFWVSTYRCFSFILLASFFVFSYICISFSVFSHFMGSLFVASCHFSWAFTFHRFISHHRVTWHSGNIFPWRGFSLPRVVKPFLKDQPYTHFQ